MTPSSRRTAWIILSLAWNATLGVLALRQLPCLAREAAYAACANRSAKQGAGASGAVRMKNREGAKRALTVISSGC